MYEDDTHFYVHHKLLHNLTISPTRFEVKCTLKLKQYGRRRAVICDVIMQILSAALPTKVTSSPPINHVTLKFQTSNYYVHYKHDVTVSNDVIMT